VLNQRQIFIVVKEKDGYKNIIDSYENEMTNVGKTDLKMRQTLEEALENMRRHATSLETERDRLADKHLQLKTRITLVSMRTSINHNGL